jgi:hypothetical protein
MEEVKLTTSELAYIIDILSKYISIEDIRKICRILISHLPPEKVE